MEQRLKKISKARKDLDIFLRKQHAKTWDGRSKREGKIKELEKELYDYIRDKDYDDLISTKSYTSN